MSYKNKAELEARFVEILLKAGGIESHAEINQGRNEYYEFRLKNGTTRHWTNMSDENLRKLGIEVDG